MAKKKQAGRVYFAHEYRTISRLPGYRFGDDGSIWSRWNGRWGITRREWKRLSSHRRGRGEGHESVTLAVDGKPVYAYVARLILEAFVGPSPEGMEGCHEDGDRSNNRLSNLRWGTSQDNAQDSIRHGTFLAGSHNANLKLSDEDVRQIRRLTRQGVPRSEIASRFNVSLSHVFHVASGAKRERVPDLTP